MQQYLSPGEQDGAKGDTVTEWELWVRCVLMVEPCGHVEFPAVS